MADRNEIIAAEILKAVGGKDNITYVNHCMTRLRFRLKDKNIAETEEVKKITGVLGVAEHGGQYQIIIGQNVPKVYSAICKLAGIADQSAAAKNPDRLRGTLTVTSIGGLIMDYMAGSMTPLIPAMIAAAMFKTLAVLLGPDMLGIIGIESSLFRLCGFVYDAFFYFLPIFLGYSAAKKLNMNPVMGIMATALLLVPGFMGLPEEGVKFTVYGIPCVVNNYSQSILPAVLTIWVMSYIEGFFKKIIPDMLTTIFTPFLTMLVIIPIELCVLAPLGSVVGEFIGKGLLSFGGATGFLGVAVVAGLWEFLVMTGMHVVLILFGIGGIASNGVDYFVLTAGGYATWAAIGMALGACFRLKNKEEKALSLSYFISGIIGGVTEPALYGIGFPYRRPFLAMAIGGFCGGLYGGIMHVGVYVMGATNFLSVLGYVGGGTKNMIHGCIGVVIAVLVSGSLTYLFGFKKDENRG